MTTEVLERNQVPKRAMIERVSIITVGEFYEKAAGGQIIFT
jgi:hypothetical protein